MLEHALRARTIVGISGQILQEVLQGARDSSGFEAMRGHLVRRPLFEPADVYNSRVMSALTYAQLRWRGITVRAAGDCLIALTAIEHGLTPLHDDADFEKIARVEPRLKLA